LLVLHVEVKSIIIRTVKFKQILSAKSNPIKAFLKIKQKYILCNNKTRP